MNNVFLSLQCCIIEITKVKPRIATRSHIGTDCIIDLRMDLEVLEVRVRECISYLIKARSLEGIWDLMGIARFLEWQPYLKNNSHGGFFWRWVLKGWFFKNDSHHASFFEEATTTIFEEWESPWFPRFLFFLFFFKNGYHHGDLMKDLSITRTGEWQFYLKNESLVVFLNLCAKGLLLKEWQSPMQVFLKIGNHHVNVFKSQQPLWRFNERTICITF